MSNSNSNQGLSSTSVVVASTPQMTREQLEAKIAALEAAALEASTKKQTLTVKIPDSYMTLVPDKTGNIAKGAIGLYGLGIRPVSLYANQWEVLAAQGIQKVLDFIKANEGKTTKDGRPIINRKAKVDAV